MATVHDFDAQLNNGESLSLSGYKGKVLLIVNTASQCGFTPQYGQLQSLYEAYKDKGLEILAFPCNQFGQQEPGDAAEIKGFCDLKFNISFPLFDKVDVNGDQAHPLFAHLSQEAPGLLGSKRIKWNFTKFLVDADGKVLKRYGSATAPEKIEPDIRRLLV